MVNLQFYACMHPGTPWDETENWNPAADIAPYPPPTDEIVDIQDVVLVAIHFGEGTF